jgi:hypothetical protein
VHSKHEGVPAPVRLLLLASVIPQRFLLAPVKEQATKQSGAAVTPEFDRAIS